MSSYFVSDTPSEGDHVVSSTTTAGSAATAIAALVHGGYKVTRVNMSTGRGTARLADDTGKAVQIVRGRFGWRLADGTAQPVRFAYPASQPEPSAADGEPVIFEGDVNAGEPPFDQDMFQPVPLDEDDELWTQDIGWGPQVTDNRTWHRVEAVPGDENQRAICGVEIPTDALVYGMPKNPEADICVWCQNGKAAPVGQDEDDDKEDPDNDPCDGCEEPTSPLYLVGGLCPACRTTPARQQTVTDPAEAARQAVYRGTWETNHPGYLELRVGGRLRGYVEERSRKVFWETTPSSINPDANSFVRVNEDIEYPTMMHAQVALMDWVARMDSCCDGRRGIQGGHRGCSPTTCKPMGAER